jgi:4-aminobutyrate aminotransferase-like enzyme
MAQFNGPRVTTPPPGPESARLFKRAEDIFLGVSLIGAWPPSHFVSRYRDGWFLEDVDGNRYIDWLAGWASAPLGGNHPELVEAAHTALKEYGTECLSSLTVWHQYELAEKLVEIAPKPLTKVVYDTTGSEVVENAVRIMREAAGPGRPFVITFLGSFHGGNYGTGAMGPHNAHYNHAIEPFMSGWINVPFPTCYRCPYHLEYPSCDIACLGYIEEMILRYKATPDSIAGVAVELIQGENGIQIPPPEWPKRLYDLCQKHGWIFYNDEVQEGMGRCGEWFLIDEYPGVEAELLSLGKGTSGGLIPICYTLGSDRMSEPAGNLYTGGTFAGSPVGCAVGVKLIEVIKRDRVLDNVKELERIAKAKFGAMKEKYEVVGDVRVKGCYQCVEFVEDKDSKEPALDVTREVVYAMERRGVIPIYEPAFNWFRPTPALNMPPELFSLGCDLVEESVAEVSKKYGKGVK